MKQELCSGKPPRTGLQQKLDVVRESETIKSWAVSSFPMQRCDVMIATTYSIQLKHHGNIPDSSLGWIFCIFCRVNEKGVCRRKGVGLSTGKKSHYIVIRCATLSWLVILIILHGWTSRKIRAELGLELHDTKTSDTRRVGRSNGMRHLLSLIHIWRCRRRLRCRSRWSPCH